MWVIFLRLQMQEEQAGEIPFSLHAVIRTKVHSFAALCFPTALACVVGERTKDVHVSSTIKQFKRWQLASMLCKGSNNFSTVIYL